MTVVVPAPDEPVTALEPVDDAAPAPETDDDGAADADDFTITVANAAPVVDAGGRFYPAKDAALPGELFRATFRDGELELERALVEAQRGQAEAGNDDPSGDRPHLPLRGGGRGLCLSFRNRRSQ